MNCAYEYDRFQGVFVAFYGCYDQSGNISAAQVRRLVKRYKEAGVKGLYLTGSSGECILQTVEERNRIVEAVMEENSGAMTIIAHTGAATTSDSVALSAFASKMRVDAISSIPNVYYQIPEPAIEAHWDRMMEAAELPFIIYNIPSTTGYNLSMSLFRKMIAKDYVMGIKNTTPSSAQINQYRRAAGERFVIFNGPDNQLLAGLLMGATGGIGGTYGCMPELYVKLYAAYEKGDYALAMDWQNRINAIIDMMQQFPYTTGLSVARSIAQARGMEIGAVRAPILPVEAEDPAIQKAAGMIEGWL